MPHIAEDPNKFLENMRKSAESIMEAANAQKKIDANLCVGLAKMFQELDEYLVEGGDAPMAWTSGPSGSSVF